MSEHDLLEAANLREIQQRRRADDAEEKASGYLNRLMRGTGGNKFVPPNATVLDVVTSIAEQLSFIRRHAQETEREFDLGSITVETKRTRTGCISVFVSADLDGGR